MQLTFLSKDVTVFRISGNFRWFRRFRRSEIFLSMEFWKKKLKFEWISNFPLKLGTFYPIKFRQWKQINQCISDFENYILNAFPTFMNCVLVFFKIRNLFIFITTLITKKRNTFMNCLLVVFKVRHLFNFITTLITKKSNNSVDCFHVLFKVRPLYDFITTVITNKININIWVFMSIY